MILYFLIALVFFIMIALIAKSIKMLGSDEELEKYMRSNRKARIWVKMLGEKRMKVILKYFLVPISIPMYSGLLIYAVYIFFIKG